GKRLLEEGNYSEAASELTTATTLLATNALAWEYLGLAYQHSGQWVEADRAYRRALTLVHDLPEADYNLGCLLLDQDKLDAAKARFTAYTMRRADAPEGFLKLGATQLRAAQVETSAAARARELSAAEKSFNEALRLSPENAEGLNGLGLVRAQRGHSTEAAQYFYAALKHRPAYPPTLLNLGIVEQEYLRNLPLALQNYREYLESKPPPANAEPVKALVRQLEQQLETPARILPTNVVPQTSGTTFAPVTSSPPPTARTETKIDNTRPDVELRPARQPAAVAPKPQPAAQPSRYHY